MTTEPDSDDRSLTVTWSDPAPSLEQAMTRSGLDYLSAMHRGEIPLAPIGSLLGITFAEVSEGRVVIRGEPGEQHLNPIGTVHGGYLSTMLDSAMGCAVHTALPAGVGYGTVSLTVNLVRPVGPQVPELLAEGKVEYVGSRQATASGQLTDPDGKLYAHSTTVCLIVK